MPKASDLMVKVFKQAGIKTVFGIPSVHNIGLYEALRQEPSIRHILCRHESSATHMADGYARSGRGVGVVITSTGPGAGYMLSPLIEAWWSCSPVLAVTSNIRTSKIGRGLGTLHEIDDQHLVFKNVTKAVFCARSPEDVQPMAAEAISTALSGRPGPVYLEVPVDLWDREADEAETKAQSPELEPLSDAATIDEAAAMLERAERPVIVAGVEAVRAGLGPEVTALAEALNAPVLTVSQAKGIIPEDHPLAFGNVSRRGVTRDILQSADVSLAVGSRLRDVHFGRRGVVLPNLIHLTWDEKWVNKILPAKLALIGDIKALSRQLEERLDPAPSRSRQDRNQELKERLDRARSEADCVELQCLEAIRRVLPRDGDLVVDNTALGYWSESYYTSYKPGGLVPASGSSIIGFAFPAAIGLKAACPDRPIAALIGDGGFFYGANELATCVRHNIGFPVIVVNNNRYGAIDYLQDANYQQGYETALVNPDIPAFAASFGIKAGRVDTPGGLGRALEEALTSGEMRVIELTGASLTNPFPLS